MHHQRCVGRGGDKGGDSFPGRQIFEDENFLSFLTYYNLVSYIYVFSTLF